MCRLRIRAQEVREKSFKPELSEKGNASEYKFKFVGAVISGLQTEQSGLAPDKSENVSSSTSIKLGLVFRSKYEARKASRLKIVAWS